MQYLLLIYGNEAAMLNAPRKPRASGMPPI